MTVILVAFLLLSNPLKAEEKDIPISFKMWDGTSKNDFKIIRDVAILIDNKKYDAALKRSDAIKKGNRNFHQALQNIIFWKKYSNIEDPENILFSDISRFVLDNNYFPNISNLEKNVEKVLFSNEVPIEIHEQYTKKKSLEITEAKLYVIEQRKKLLTEKGLDDKQKKAEILKIRNLVSDVWVNNDFTEDEQLEFLEKYQDILTNFDHISRIDRLLWQDKTIEATRSLPLLEDDYQKLFIAIINLSKSPKYIDNIILSVPRKLRGNEHLQYKRAYFYHKNNKKDKVYEILLDMPNGLNYQKKWWKLRHYYSRELLKDKRFKEAYKIANYHDLSSDSFEFTEASWLSGWIALRFLDNPDEAIRHFKNMYDNVSYPISVSRASYWLGMAFEAKGNKKTAIGWYKISHSYPTYFYGQIAIHKYRKLKEEVSLNYFTLPEEPVIFDNDIKIISYKMALRVAYLLTQMNEKQTALKIIKKIIKNLNSRGKIGAIIKLVEEIDDEELTHKVYRYANRKNVFYIDKQFKIIEEIKEDKNAALIHALIKQESGFAKGAVSSVGAVGFMQIMPATAKQVARKLKVKYSKKRLGSDIKYNIKLGSHYIDTLINKFDSKVLAIAAYNAGPNRTIKWIKEFYDPRSFSNPDNYDNNDLDKVIDFIELITYSETRNYVQRVMENLLVYNYLMP